MQNITRYRRTPKGILTNMYDHMRRRNKVEFTLKEFHGRYLEDKKFLQLCEEWRRNGYKKQFKPSLDRIHPKKPYTVKNTHMITWAENRFKQSLDGKLGRKPRVYQMLGDKTVAVFQSQRHAVKALGLSQGNLSMVLTGKRETTAGYKFIYETPELLTNN